MRSPENEGVFLYLLSHAGSDKNAMAEMMVISCPDCATKMKVPESTLGKKLRCKSCQQVFTSKLPETAPAVKEQKKAPSPKSKEPPKPPPKVEAPLKFKEDEDEEDTKNPYGMKEVEEGTRCPQCANLMESEESYICLNCGFNTRTRTEMKKRRIKEITGQDKFLWLLPGILCCVAILAMIGYWCFHHFALPGIIWEKWDEISAKHPTRAKALADEALEGGWYLHASIELWMAIIFAFLSVAAGRFAVKRLIMNPNPPEVEL